MLAPVNWQTVSPVARWQAMHGGHHISPSSQSCLYQSSKNSRAVRVIVRRVGGRLGPAFRERVAVSHDRLARH